MDRRPTDELAYGQAAIEHPVESFDMADVDAVDILLPYEASLIGHYRTLRITTKDEVIRLTDYSAIPGNHQEKPVTKNPELIDDAPFYEVNLQPGMEVTFGRAEENNPGHLPLLERSFVSREHFDLSLSLDGLALTVKTRRTSRNGMRISPLKKPLADLNSYLYG